MEGGQKQEISLESGLDVKSSDQLVPVSQPLFQHNRQRFQGSMLPTSLRYEHNGWACGWDVYEFALDLTSVPTEPTGYNVSRSKFNDNPAYIFSAKQGSVTYVRLYYNEADTVVSGDFTISRDTENPHVAILKGMNGDHEFEITVDMLTGEIGYDAAGWHVSEDSYSGATDSSGITTLNIVDLLSWVVFNTAIVEAVDAKYNGVSIAPYSSCLDGVHAWKDTSGGDWEISYDSASGECLVNGEAAAADLSLSDGTLSIDYDTAYEGTASVALNSETFYFQLADIYAKQTIKYIDSSNVTTEDFGQWALYLTGSQYLNPTEGDSPVAYISGYVPYWGGASIRYGSTGSAESVDISILEPADGYTVNGGSPVFSGTMYILTSDYVSLFDGEMRGVAGSFWLGENECLEKYGTLESENTVSYEDINASLSYSACVFNRIAITEGEESEFTYSVPLRAGHADTELLEVTEDAPWLNSFTAMSKAGSETNFEAGFYIKTEYFDGEGYEAGYYIHGDPSLYPDKYEDIDIVGDGSEHDGYVRLSFPYAYYDIEVVSEGWSGTRYVGETDDESVAGASSVDLSLSLSNSRYTDPESLKTYYLGEPGYLLPYYATTETGYDPESETDTRLLENVVSGSDSTETDTVTMTFTSGPLSGWEICLSVYVSWTSESSNSGDDTGSKDYAKSVAQKLAQSVARSSSLLSEGWIASHYEYWAEKAAWPKGWRGFYKVYFFRLSGTVSLVKDDTTVWTSSSNASESLSEILESFDIKPIGAYINVTGLGQGVTGSLAVYLSLCFPGYFQSDMRLLNNSGDGVFTSDQLLGCVSLSPSDTLRLVKPTGAFYIDRDVESGSLFGIKECQLNAHSASISGESASISMYMSPAESSKSVYLYTGSDSDCYITGTVYTNSAGSFISGYNLTGTLLGSSYSSSQITFSIEATVTAFQRALSGTVEWDAESGTHEFFSAVLPSAVKELSFSSVVFGTPSSTASGSASGAQSINLQFNGKQMQVMARYTLSGNVASTEISMTSSPVEADYMGYPFSFSLGGSTWDSLTLDIDLAVSVPLKYLISAGVPYQYNGWGTLEYDEASGKYVIDGEELDAIPVGSLATGYDALTSVYSFTSDGGYAYTFSPSTALLSYGIYSFDAEKAGLAWSCGVESCETLELSFVLKGLYKASDGAEIVSFDDESITFRYNGTDYTFELEPLMTDEASNVLNFMYTDTTDDAAVPESVTFAKQNVESEYQFLRQQWNTTIEVENFWWIDEDTILELNREAFTVKRKVSSFSDYDEDVDVDIDDWGGDAWKVAYSFDRGSYIDNTVARYGVTSAYGGAKPRLWTVSLASASAIKITFYTLSGSDYSWSLEGVSVTVPLNNVSIGSQLNSKEGSLNTYSQLSASSLVFEAKYSGTVVGEHILFGIHLDKNFNQWALDVSVNGNLNLVVQGYGYVGLNGCLTGGEIPSSYFNPALGFTGTVLPIDELEQEDVEYMSSMSAFLALDAEGKVVGDESQQWYITKSLHGVVSHLEWNGGSWEAVALPITNTYASCYGSPSYGKRLISDFAFWGQKISQLISDDTFTSAVSLIVDLLTTRVYGYSPKVTTALYLQQTVGQYAYVHCNSSMPGKQKDVARDDTSDNPFGDHGIKGTSYTAIGFARKKEEEPIEAVSPERSDDFSFNLHGLRQSISVENPWPASFGIMMVIMCGLSSLTSTLSGVFDTLKVNAQNNEVSASDIGRKFGQSFLTNMGQLASMGTSVVGVLPTLQSAVAAVCTLDMFYSTSEGQKVEGGPGWVQHNLVAQCVAQSVTSCQFEMQQIGMLWILEGLSSLVAKIAFEAAKIAWEICVETAAATKEGSTLSTNYGWIAAVAMLFVGGVAYAVCATYKVLAEATDALIKCITGGNAKVEVQNAASRHTYDVEGKHKYGTKSEVFMWPCFDVNSKLRYTDEIVTASLSEHNWNLTVPLTSGASFMGGASSSLGTISLEGVLGERRQDDDVVSSFDGDIVYQIANCKGTSVERSLPSDMAAVIGVDSFLPPVPFRNDNVGVDEPRFLTPAFQDYIIDKDWELSLTAGESLVTWISCKDTKLIDGDYSNVVVSDSFCGVASPYCAIEVKRGCEEKYIRPWAITPTTLALNQTGFNCCHDRKAYHGFDGYGFRMVKWCGAPGLNKEGWVWQYSFIVNDRLKRSNRIFRNEFNGNFKGDPTIALRTTGEDWVYNHMTVPGPAGESYGLEAGTIGEDKDTRRYAVPVFSELVSTLPAVVKTISSINLSVIDGVTSLTTDNRDLQSAYKAPMSVDFSIGKEKYRFTEEYISGLNVDMQFGVTVLEDLVPTLGLTYLGSTPYEAYLYSEATRQYYKYTGGSSLEAVDTIERFRNVLYGRYDFVNQEVALPCVATFTRLDKHVFDDEDERDNTIVPRLKGGQFVGEVSPPIETIYSMRSGFKTISLPAGLCYQGPNRCIINRFVYSDYMKEQIIENYGKWKRVPREEYHPFRDYGVEYERVDETVQSLVSGWTHNPFLLVTSPLGNNSETDCVFEWEVTFAWPVEMDELYAVGQYAVVNLWGECFTPGGKVIPDRPAHVFLWRDLFTRTGNYGYYSFRYQSRCGAGNRERLHIWSDQYIAVSGLQVDVKPVTEKRTEVLTQQADVMEMSEI